MGQLFEDHVVAGDVGCLGQQLFLVVGQLILDGGAGPGQATRHRAGYRGEEAERDRGRVSPVEQF